MDEVALLVTHTGIECLKHEYKNRDSNTLEVLQENLLDVGD